jgi:hypothetical protein
MSKLIRRTVGSKKRCTALIVAVQLTALTLLSLVSFVSSSSSQCSGRLTNERGRAGVSELPGLWPGHLRSQWSQNNARNNSS